MSMPDILERIVATKRREVAAGMAACPCPALPTEPTRDFAGALRGPGPGVRLIAEIKRASPSRGVIRPDFDPVEIARRYQAGGAAALSVLTDREFFQGELAFLGQVREAVGLPLLRKDFIIHRWQLVESRAAGADAVLLIARLLDEVALRDFLERAGDLGLACLVEVHDEMEVARALAAGARIVGINNRDLATFRVDLAVTARLRPLIPPGVTVVSESGITVPEHARRLRDLGVQAMLIGEALMRESDPGQAAATLLAGGLP